MKHLFFATILSCFSSMLFFSCVPSGPQIKTTLTSLSKEIQAIKKEGGMACTPYALAHADSEMEFSKLELSQGQHVYASTHLNRAQRWSQVARKEIEGFKKRNEHWKCLGKPKPKPIVVDLCAKDTDRDGIPDCVDQCLTRAEDFQSYEDMDGCPDATRDRDGDGIPDYKDRCPLEPEDFNGYQDEDGCPDAHLDTDEDKVPDYKDKCPLQFARTADGCPKKYQDVVVTKKKITLKKKIYFATAKAIIRRKSYKILNTVASVLKDQPDLFVCIEGHTDNQGPKNYNLRLSQQRAASVRKFLVRLKINSERIRSRGYGLEFPIDTNSTPSGRQNNRRVEFIVVEKNDKCPRDK